MPAARVVVFRLAPERALPTCHPEKLARVEGLVILGRGGAGKSVLARELGLVTGLPVVELDQQLWSAALEPMPLDDWAALQAVLADEPRWIMDGDLGPYDDVAPRLRRADTVVVLDLPLW